MDKLRFAVIGINHPHIYMQVNALRDAGGEPAGYFALEDDLAAQFEKGNPDIPRVKSEQELLGDESIQVVTSSAVPAERAPLGVRVMRAGKDFLTDKPGATTLSQMQEVRRVQRETGRIYSIYYSERFESRVTVKAAELARNGAIGKVIQTIGLGPHRINLPTRPAWFFDRERYGGILTDIGSHQCDQFMYFTNSTSAEVVKSQVANYHYPQYPGLEDFGEVMLRGDGGHGYFRVDWFTPAGLPTWGDTRLVVLGTDAYMDARKAVDLATGTLNEALFLVDKEKVHTIDCSNVQLTFARQFLDDVRNRTELAMSQEHCFHAMELALRAEEQASKLGNLQK